MNLNEISNKFYKKVYEPRTHTIYSFRVVNFSVGLMMILISLVNLLVFGIEEGRYVELGAVFGFQGVSWWYAIGLFPLIAGVLLLTFSIFTYTRIKFDIDLKKEAIKITEHTLIRNETQEVSFKRLTGISYSNRPTATRMVWILLIVPYILYNFEHGWGNLFLPQLSGFPIAAFMILGSTILMFIILIVFVIFNPIKIWLYTDDGKYEIDIAPYLINILNDDIIPKFIPIINVDETSFYHTPKRYNANENKIAIFAGLVLFITSWFQFMFIDRTLAFADDLSIHIGIILSLLLVLEGFNTKIMNHFSDKPIYYPFLIRVGFLFDAYLCAPMEVKQRFRKCQPFTFTKLTKFILIVMSCVLIITIIRLIIGMIYAPNFLLRGILSIFYHLILLFIVIRILFFKHLGIVYNFCEEKINYMILPIFRSTHALIKYVFTKIHHKNRDR
ncbi:MAG: hypothetical protein GF364_15250 [Candidatus Lokiarchaeota archaeon]|nr:hypothetical protein [Candidatus Lokiarchaeota archaeon]